MNVTLTAIDYEEKEALSRDPEQDVETFNQTCEDIRTKLAEMKICKKDNNAENDVSLSLFCTAYMTARIFV